MCMRVQHVYVHACPASLRMDHAKATAWIQNDAGTLMAPILPPSTDTKVLE